MIHAGQPVGKGHAQDTGGACAALVGVAGGGDQIAREGPWLLLAVSAVMLVVGLLSCVVPAMRGLRIEPTEALRQRG